MSSFFSLTVGFEELAFVPRVALAFSESTLLTAVCFRRVVNNCFWIRSASLSFFDFRWFLFDYKNYNTKVSKTNLIKKQNLY